MGPEIIVPITVFASFVLIFWFGFNSSTRKREAALATVRAVVEKTGELSPELIKAIGQPRDPKNADLRRGLVLLAIAAAFVGLGFIAPMDDSDAPRILAGIALFPGLVGGVFVLLHFMGGKDDV